MSGALVARDGARDHDLGGGLSVRRVLPQRRPRALGPFVFVDHFGPTTLPPERPMDVRPHPHIGLATLTYLWAGRIRHRDGLGYDQLIEPGAVNWMTAGRGIVHSERSDARDRGRPLPLHGLQVWLALPLADEDAEPAFSHTPADALPALDVADARVVVVAGSAYGARSPVPALGAPLYVDVRVPDGGRLPLPDGHGERGAYVIDGALAVDGDAEPLRRGELGRFANGADIALRARGDAHAVLLGGAPLDAPRYLWWNFVASSRGRIERAKRVWADGGFDRIAGDDESIPLPQRREVTTLPGPGAPSG